MKYRANLIKFRGRLLWNAHTDDIEAFNNVATLKKKVIARKVEVATANYVNEILFFYPFFHLSQ